MRFAHLKRSTITSPLPLCLHPICSRLRYIFSSTIKLPTYIYIRFCCVRSRGIFSRGGRAVRTLIVVPCFTELSNEPAYTRISSNIMFYQFEIIDIVINILVFCVYNARALYAPSSPYAQQFR